MRLKRWLRTLGAYRLWRAWRARGQRRDFVALLDTELGDGNAPGYSERLLGERLSTLRGARRPVLLAPAVTRVFAVGTTDWEQHGLWPAFESVTDFVLFDYQAFLRREGVAESAEDVATRLERAILAALEERESNQWSPSVLFFYAGGRFISSALLRELRARGIWSVVMSLDDKHQFTSPRDSSTGESHQLRVASECDLYWTTWKTGTQIVLQRGGRPWYAPEGAGAQFHRPLGLARDLEVVFIGQPYGHRRALVEYLRARGFAVTAVGAGWPGGFVSFEQTVELFNRAHVVLGVGGVGHLSEVKHLKGRDFEVPMCGALYLTSFNPELADCFEIGREILCYGSFEECADMLHWLRRHPEEADSVRARALARSRSEHTWETRVRACLTLLATH